ncbi:MAG: hypothetical protein Q9227_007637 [Pyrenula ochraceoflavens]
MRDSDRDRSPTRTTDRRPSLNYGSRPSDDSTSTLSREPPRGPKAMDAGRSHISSAPRSRPFSARPDYRDRDRDRDYRSREPSLLSRRPDEQRSEWDRRGGETISRDNRSYSSRRSRSPPAKDRWDTKYSPTTPHEPPKLRRESKESLPPFSSRSQDNPAWSARGRGRADFGRGRERGSAVEADPYRPRSRSRETWRERDSRGERDRREIDYDRRDRSERRDLDKWHDREGRDKDLFPTKRDRPPSRNSVGSSTVTTPSATQPPVSISSEKPPAKPFGDTGRRYSVSTTTGPRRDAERTDYFSLKMENTQRAPSSRAMSPAPAPQVPAFGAPLDFPPGPKKNTTPQVPETKLAAVPTGPKISTTGSQVNQGTQPPTAPKAIRDSMYSTNTRETKIAAAEARPKDVHPSVPRPVSSNTSNVSRPVPVAPTGPRATSLLNRPSPRMPTEATLATNASSSYARPTFAEPGARGSPLDSLQGAPSTIHKPTSMQWVNPAYQHGISGSRLGVQGAQGTTKESSITTDAASAAGTPIVLPSAGKDSQIVEASDAKLENNGLPTTSPVLTQINHDSTAPAVSNPPNTFENRQLSEEEGEEDEDMGLDEEDFAASESKYQRDRDALLLRRPPSPLKDPEIVEKLVKMQLLRIIAAKKVPKELTAMKALNNAEKTQESLDTTVCPPVPKQERETMPSGRPLRRLKNPPQNVMLTPPLESLPYLERNESDSGTSIETFNALIDSQDESNEELWHKLHVRHRQETSCNDELRDTFTSMYRPWRLHVTELDRKQREAKPLTPAPASPPLSAVPTAVPTPVIERTRGAKNMTELDFQNILRASEQSAREDQARRERGLNSKADPEKEAIIPPMMNEIEQDASVFEDCNQIVLSDNVLDMYDYVPLRDDFNEDEQKAFTQAYLTWPKKWGKIAESLPDRDFQQCILHYYLTKQAQKYKDAVRKNQGKRGRRTKGPATRPKSNALMADLGVRPDVYEGDEFDTAPPAVTDTGRPRRAAAPTFGDNGPDSETPSGGPPRPRGNHGKELAPDQTSERPTRGGKRAAKGTRKPKGQAVPAVGGTGPSPQKPGGEVLTITKAPRGTPKAEASLPRIGESQLQDSQRHGDHEIERQGQFSLVSGGTESETVAPNFQVYHHQQPHQPSSYWSVYEVRDFPNLLKHFGRNYEAISNHMRTKTPIMVKNYYVRGLENGKSEFEKYVEEAEARKQRGDTMPPPPVPTAHLKRKYEAASATVSQRPLAPSTEASETDEPAVTTSKPVIFDRSPPTVPQGSPPSEFSINARVQSASQSAAAPIPPGLIKGEDNVQPVRSSSSGQSRPNQGPKIGIFNDDRREARQNSSAAQLVPQQHATMHLLPPQPQEKTRTNQTHHQTILPQRQNIAPQPVQQSPAQIPQVGPSIGHSSYVAQPTMSQHATPSSMAHIRHGSNASPSSVSSVNPKHEVETGFARRQDTSLSIRQFGASPVQSPSIPRPPTTLPLQKEAPRPSSNSAPPTQEAPRATPAKRSNIMSILNDEPEEPQPSKRVTTDQTSATRIPSVKSPPPTMYSQNPPQIHSGHIYNRRDEMQPMQTQQSQGHRSSFSNHSVQGPMHPPSTLPPPQNQSYGEVQSGGWAGEPAPTPSPVVQNWINRFDPRVPQHHTPPSGTPDPSNRRQQVSMSPYAGPSAPIQPTATMSSSMPSQSVPSSQYHRMAIQQSVLPPNPSPPPPAQPPPSAAASFRTHSSNAQHSRMSSYSAQQPVLHVHTTANVPPGHPHSAPSSAVPALSRQPSNHFDNRPMPGTLPPTYGSHQGHVQPQQQVPLQSQHSISPSPTQPQNQQPRIQLGNEYAPQPGRIYTPPTQPYHYQPQVQYRHYGQHGDERR